MRTILTCAVLLGAFASGCNGGGTSNDAATPSDLGASVDAIASDTGNAADGFVSDAATPDATAPVDSAATDARPDTGLSFCNLMHPCVGSAQYCSTPDGMCGGDGQCAIYQPTMICQALDMPVCGCDGVTYSNPCEAQSSGHSIASQGACPTTGCRTDAECAGTEFCQFPDGLCGGVGMCQSLGRTLNCNTNCTPECGCNGITYRSACFRHKAGTSLMQAGACPGTTPPC